MTGVGPYWLTYIHIFIQKQESNSFFYHLYQWSRNPNLINKSPFYCKIRYLHLLHLHSSFYVYVTKTTFGNNIESEKGVGRLVSTMLTTMKTSQKLASGEYRGFSSLKRHSFGYFWMVLILFAKIKTLLNFRNRTRKAGLSFLHKEQLGSNRCGLNKVMIQITFCLNSHSDWLGNPSVGSRRCWSRIQSLQRKSIKPVWTIIKWMSVKDRGKDTQLSVSRKWRPSGPVLPGPEGHVFV